jgi:drug/metabolite transporter (DMT)-like permease
MLLAPMAYLFFTCFDTASKYLAARTSVYQIIALELLVAAGIILLWSALEKRGQLKKEFRLKRKGLHLARGLILCLSQTMFFTGFQHMNLAEFYVILFLVPIMTGLIAAWFLKEKMTLALVLALVAGFGGVVVALKPAAGFSAFALLVLGGTVFNAIALVLLREMMKTETVTMASVSVALVMSFASAIPALFHFHPMRLPDVEIALLGGVCFGIGQRILTTALQLAPASYVVPAQFLQLVYGAVTGYLVFADVPAASIYLGGAMVIAANLFLLWKQSRKEGSGIRD